MYTVTDMIALLASLTCVGLIAVLTVVGLVLCWKNRVKWFSTKAKYHSEDWMVGVPAYWLWMEDEDE